MITEKYSVQKMTDVTIRKYHVKMVTPSCFWFAGHEKYTPGTLLRHIQDIWSPENEKRRNEENEK